jgi:Fic family protein
MGKRTTGKYERVTVGGEEVAAFIPYPLPPTDPPVRLDAALAERLRVAEQALVRLDLAGAMVPSLDWFRYAFVRKEAVLSSQIEGTQATLIDLLTFEAHDGGEPGVSSDADVEEVCNYVDALDQARSCLGDPNGLPLSMRLLNTTHERLMRGARGADKLPGEVRRSQNWIGGSRPGNAVYVPPPPHALGDVLGDLERYFHASDSLPPLVRAGHPVVTAASARRLLATTKPTAGRAIERLIAAGVLVETTGKKRDRSFVYRAYLDRLRVGTELQGESRE